MIKADKENNIFGALKLIEQLYLDGEISGYVFRNILQEYKDNVCIVDFTCYKKEKQKGKNMPSEIRIKGVSLARDTETIIPFIQPLTPEHNKNVWEGCAVIIAEKSDEDLKPYLVELLGWLQDMNWPGAFCILNRLQRYADNNSLRDAINICIEKARKCRNEVWEGNLCLLLHKH